jgi:hypothetical protein
MWAKHLAQQWDLQLEARTVTPLAILTVHQ